MEMSMKPFYTISALVISTIVATKLSLPWYVGLCFVWGATDIVSRLYNAIEKANREMNK